MKKLAMVVSAGLVFSLAACGGNDENNASGAPIVPPPPPAVKAVAATVSKATVVGASCAVFSFPKAAGAAALATGTTSPTGTVSINVPAGVGAVVMECTGGQYVNEATGATEAIPSGSPLRVIAPASSGANSTTTLAVTPFTEIAAALAISNISKLPAEQQAAQAANVASTAIKSVEDAFFPPSAGVSILTPPPTVSGTTANLDSSPASIYATYLAAIAKLAQDGGVTVTQALATLAGDLIDGSLDGKVSGTQTALYTTGTALQNSLDAAASEYATESGNADTAAAVDAEVAESGGDRETEVDTDPTDDTGAGT